MAEPITFSSSTARINLPLLFSGQAQKEFFVNQALAIIDTLNGNTVSAVLAAPPLDPVEGSCYLVGASPTDDWIDRSDQLACRIGDSWHYIDPVEGMEIFDQASGQKVVYSSEWSRAVEPTEPSGGSVVDVEARSAIVELIAALSVAGVLPKPQ